jgi:hypothetical protein
MKKRPAAPSIFMDILDFFYSGSAAPNHLLPKRPCATEGSTFSLLELGRGDGMRRFGGCGRRTPAWRRSSRRREDPSVARKRLRVFGLRAAPPQDDKPRCSSEFMTPSQDDNAAVWQMSAKHDFTDHGR